MDHPFKRLFQSLLAMALFLVLFVLSLNLMEGMRTSQKEAQDRKYITEGIHAAIRSYEMVSAAIGDLFFQDLNADAEMMAVLLAPHVSGGEY